MPKKTRTQRAFLADGRYVDVPMSAVREWQDDVRNGGTTTSLADWYTEDADDAAEIQGRAIDDTRCDHEEHSHRVANQSQTGAYDADKPTAMTRVCHRRGCILDALAWVERNSGEPAAWAAPGQAFRFDVPKDIPAPQTPAPVANQGSRLSAIMADHDRGPEYALAQCAGSDYAGDHVGELTCVAQQRINGSKNLSDAEITAHLAELGWSVKPTLCPKHNISQGQVPLPLPEMAR